MPNHSRSSRLSPNLKLRSDDGSTHRGSTSLEPRASCRCCPACARGIALSRPFAPSSFLGKVGTFQSEFLPIFYPRHGNVFGGAKANVISITRGLAHTNTSLQHLQANIFTMPSSKFTPTFSHRDACLLFFHLLQHHWTPHLLPAARACPHNLHNPPHKRS